MPNKPYALSVKVVILEKSGCCLLLKRSLNDRWNPGKWEFPGGKVEPGEQFDEALLRETMEETGLIISLIRVVGATEFELLDRKVAEIIMEGHLESGEVHLSNEHDDYAWVALRELTSMDLAEQSIEFANMI